MTGPRSSKRAAKKSKHDSDDGAGPSTSKPKAASVLPPDVASIIVGMLLAEKDRFWDEAELCNVAAKALCVGDPDFTELGKQLYAGLSPRLGMDIDATEKSTAPALKAKLKVKAWGLQRVHMLCVLRTLAEPLASSCVAKSAATCPDRRSGACAALGRSRSCGSASRTRLRLSASCVQWPGLSSAS